MEQNKESPYLLALNEFHEATHSRDNSISHIAKGLEVLTGALHSLDRRLSAIERRVDELPRESQSRFG
jgi:hypothetical protein